MSFNTYLKLHIRHHDNSFNHRFIQVYIEAETEIEMKSCYDMINSFLVKIGDKMKQTGMYPEDIYEAMQKILKDEFGLVATITQNESNLAVYKEETSTDTGFRLKECTFKQFMKYIKKA